MAKAKAKLSSLVAEVESREDAVTITRHGVPAAVLLSPDEFESWQETLAIRSDAEFMEEIRRGLRGLAKTKRRYALKELLGREG